MNLPSEEITCIKNTVLVNTRGRVLNIRKIEALPLFMLVEADNTTAEKIMTIYSEKNDKELNFDNK